MDHDIINSAAKAILLGISPGRIIFQTGQNWSKLVKTGQTGQIGQTDQTGQNWSKLIKIANRFARAYINAILEIC